MRTITTNIYMYSELSDAAKAKARDWWREASAHDNYFVEPVIDEAKEFGALLGIDIERVGFSGFSSQGDGAHFVGRWRADECTPAGVAKLVDAASQDKALHAIARKLLQLAYQAPGASYRVKHSGHYSHAHCTDFDFEFGYEGATDAPAEWEADVMQASRDYMNWIYRQLEAAYNDEQSDENVAEVIQANEYEFTADGKRV